MDKNVAGRGSWNRTMHHIPADRHCDLAATLATVDCHSCLSTAGTNQYYDYYQSSMSIGKKQQNVEWRPRAISLQITRSPENFQMFGRKKGTGIS
jgi:hypothetical protein